MLCDVVQEAWAMVVSLVLSKLQQVKGEANEQKLSSNGLSDDANERLGTLGLFEFDSILESA